MSIDVRNKEYEVSIARKKIGHRKLSIMISQKGEEPIELFDVRFTSLPTDLASLPLDPMPLDSAAIVKILLNLFDTGHLSKQEAKRYNKMIKRRVIKDTARIDDAIKKQRIVAG